MLSSSACLRVYYHTDTQQVVLLYTLLLILACGHGIIHVRIYRHTLLQTVMCLSLITAMFII